MAQQPGPEIMAYLRDNPRRFAFNIHSYEVGRYKDTPAPKGYKAFYISHYGRHGSRGSWGCEPYMRVEAILARASELGILSPAGDSLLAVASYVKECQWGMDGELTPKGAAEHMGIAERMYRRFPSVFKKGSVRAVSSTVPRCLVSMSSFISGLASCRPSLDFSMTTGGKYMDYISKADTREIRDSAVKVTSKIPWSPLTDTVTVMKNLFTDPENARMLIPDFFRFENDVFTTAMVAEPYGVKENAFRFLPEEILVRRYVDIVLSAYLCQCNSLELGDLRMKEADKLLGIMVGQADEAIAGNGPAADLCFGHDWPFLGICCRFGLEGIGSRLDAMSAIESWNATKYCPLAANLQLIFYRTSRKDGDILVKFLVNEEETPVRGIEPVSGPYYRWEDVKKSLGLSARGL